MRRNAAGLNVASLLVTVALLGGCPSLESPPSAGQPLGMRVATAHQPAANHAQEGQLVTFGVEWPRNRAVQVVPDNARAVTFFVTRNDLLVSKVTITRDPNIPTPTKTVRLYPGDYKVEARAFDTYSPKDDSLVHADGASTFTVLEGQDTTVEVLLELASSPVPGLGFATLPPSTLPTSDPSGTAEPMPDPNNPNPQITTLVPANAGPGAVVSIKGGNFGSLGAKSFGVSFNGLAATNPARLDDGEIRAVVPHGATSGLVTVTVGSTVSNGMSFKVLKTLRLEPSSMELLRGQSFVATATVQDTGGMPILNPSIQWGVQGRAIQAAGSTWTAQELGDATVSISSGTLRASSAIHVFQVEGVVLSSAVLTLNAMPETGAPDPGYQTTGRLTATVLASDRPDRRTSWASSNAALVSVTDGWVQTMRGAASGSAVITARSVDDPTQFATASVIMTIKGGLAVEVE